ncbi:oxysterol-binding protein-related protein 11-like isoform X1 [Mytilus trossulus]|uniref:oxysterol-binding protein-related protein 11-like isoform X1 n=2 Tax=Mytilus trossulus TaxID=6551 RepID=UPI00300656E7
MRKMESQENRNNSELPDLSSLSETERLQVIAVMQRAKEFEETEDKVVNRRQAMEGTLNKYTNVMKGWQHRWFLLDPQSGMLEYFEKEEYKKQRPRGFLHLAAAVICPSDEDSQTFSVSASNGETYRLRASDAKERQLWVDKLRSTAEYFTAHMSKSASFTKDRSSSGISVNELFNKKRSDSNEQIHNQRAVVSRPPHRAPASRPHTLDPFREVKEYLIEAEDYSHHLQAKCASLPVSEEPIGGLDKDLLLLKATSSATLTCLSQCLKMLEHKQGVGSHTHSLQLGIEPALEREIPKERSHSFLSNVSENSTHELSRAGSFSSANVKFPLTDDHPEGPINHEEEVEDDDSYHDTDLEGVEEHKSIILHLLSQLKLGMDLTKVVLPTFILERRSLLEMFADCMAHPDVFLKIPDLPDPESRMMAVLEWYLTSFHAGRQGSVAKKPYNPIIGETFHCSWKLPKKSKMSDDEGSSVDTNQSSVNIGEENIQLIYCAEQVSHHPPVSAFYFECPGKQMCMDASIYTKSKFYGMSIGVNLIGKIKLKLLALDEEYVFSMPSAYARSILTVPWAEMGDKINMTCQKTNLSSTVTFHTKPFYGGKLHRVSAEVKNNSTGNVFCKVQGEWNNVIEFSYSDGRSKTIDVTSLETCKKKVRPIDKQGDFESRRLWQHVTNALRAHDVNTATEHKRLLEERQREGERHRKETSTQYPTKYFKKDGDGWTYNNILQKGDYRGSL